MAATELLSVDDDAETSADVVISAGSPVAVGLKTEEDTRAIPAGAEVEILLTDDDAQLWRAGLLTAARPIAVLSVPGTYKLRRIPREHCNVGAFRAA